MASGEVYIWEGNLVEDGIWLGSEETAHCDISEFTIRNVTHVLTVGLGIPMPHSGVSESTLFYEMLIFYFQIVEITVPAHQSNRSTFVQYSPAFCSLLRFY